MENRPDPPAGDVPTAQIQACLDRANAGDATAKDELLRFVHTRLRVRASKVLRARYSDLKVETGDVVGELYVQLLKYWNRSLFPPAAGDGAPAARPTANVKMFFGWAGRVMRNILSDTLKKAERQQAIGAVGDTPSPGADPVAGHTDPADRASRDELNQHFPQVRRALLEAIEELSDEDRAVVNLHLEGGFSHKEVAAALGLRNEETARNRWRRAQFNLRKLLEGRKIEGGGMIEDYL